MAVPDTKPQTVSVSEEDAKMIRKIHRILASGKEALIQNGKNGELKILWLSKILVKE